MSYGPYFEIPHTTDGREVTIVMRPARDGDAAAMAALTEDFITSQFVTMMGSMTVKDEEEFYEANRANKDMVLWVIAIREEGEPERVIGNTSLHRKRGNRLTSGIYIGDRAWWHKGIASATHRFRTWYAFCELGAYAIDSEYIEANVASGSALRNIGYVETGRIYRDHLTAGVWYDSAILSCYNPATTSVLWPDGDIPKDVKAALERTQSALEEAAKIIQPR